MDLQSPTSESTRIPWTRVAAGVFAGSCFFPYPAVSVGTNNGLQLSQVLAMASVPLLCTRAPGRSFKAFLILMVPICLSMLVNVMFGDLPAPKTLPKEAIALGAALLILWPTEWTSHPRLFGAVLAAAASAIVVHAMLGLYQLYSFRNDEFPLLFLYRNPSFKSMEEWAPIYALYIKRPCGLFPEPSAMTASLGPWLVLLTGLLLDPTSGEAIGWRDRRLAGLAVGGGFLLVALSRSGATFAIMAAVAALCVGKARSRVAAFGLGRLAAVSGMLLAVAAVLAFAVSQLSGNLEDRVETSWGLRGLSIWAGLTTNADLATLPFGVGPGQSTPIIRAKLAGVPLPNDQDELSIFSLAVSYYMEMGLLGASAMLAVLARAVRAVLRSSAALLGFCALGPWLVGVVVTTSYMPLSPIWLFLGALLFWDRLFPVPAAATAAREAWA